MDVRRPVKVSATMGLSPGPKTGLMIVCPSPWEYKVIFWVLLS